MEIFHDLKNKLKMFGILKENSSPKAVKLAKIKNILTFSILISGIISTTFYLLFADKTPPEYTESIIETLFAILVFMWYSTLYWKRQTYADLFIELDEKINKRK